MIDKLSLQLALFKKKNKDLKEMLDNRNNGEKIDPKAGKPELIKNLTPYITEDEVERIIDEAFNTPNSRYNAHLAKFKKEIPDKKAILKKVEQFNKEHKYDSKKLMAETNTKEEMLLTKFDEVNEITFKYTYTKRRAVYDEDVLESKTVAIPKKIKVTINQKEKKVSVFTGDRDHFNRALSALTVILGFPITPLEVNKTGISETIRGSFSFHTIKVIDFIYHGLSKVGKLGLMDEIELETPSKSKKPQQVKVKGTDLLDDKSICEYLFIHARELVGFKTFLSINLNGVSYSVKIDVDITDSRIRVGVQKGEHTLENVKKFYALLNMSSHKLLPQPGLINEKETVKILDKIRKKAL